LNPIEQVFAKLKTLLRKTDPRKIETTWRYRRSPRPLHPTGMRQLPRQCRLCFSLTGSRSSAQTLTVWNPRMNRKYIMYNSQFKDSIISTVCSCGWTCARRMLAFAAIGLAAFLGGCIQDGLMDMARFQLKPDDIIIERRPDAAYEKLFPYYVELCAASQFRSKLTGEGGGPAGHAILYIKGACKDDNAPFPQLRRCRGIATSLEDPEHGAGISVNPKFKNINWVAVPGYDLVFPGGLAPGERLTSTRFEALEQKAIVKGVYTGVTFHPFLGATSDTELHDFLPRAGIGTDFALQFARSVFCARLP